MDRKSSTGFGAPRPVHTKRLVPGVAGADGLSGAGTQPERLGLDGTFPVASWAVHRGGLALGTLVWLDPSGVVHPMMKPLAPKGSLAGGTESFLTLPGVMRNGLTRTRLLHQTVENWAAREELPVEGPLSGHAASGGVAPGAAAGVGQNTPASVLSRCSWDIDFLSSGGSSDMSGLYLLKQVTSQQYEKPLDICRDFRLLSALRDDPGIIRTAAHGMVFDALVVISVHFVEDVNDAEAIAHSPVELPKCQAQQFCSKRSALGHWRSLAVRGSRSVWDAMRLAFDNIPWREHKDRSAPRCDCPEYEPVQHQYDFPQHRDVFVSLARLHGSFDPETLRVFDTTLSLRQGIVC